MGTLADQDEQTYLKPLSSLFQWYGENSRHYAGMTPAARVGLYQSQATERFGALTPYRSYQTGSFRGAYGALVFHGCRFNLSATSGLPTGPRN